MNIFQKIKALFAVKSTVDDILKEAKMPTVTGKPGWKTTEFWLNAATQIGVLWGAIHGFIPQPWASIISISGVAVYTVARTVAKAVTDIQAAKAVTAE
jgi:hypothetical protein